MKTNCVIGLCGHMNAGKDTVGRMILEAVGGEALALADPMKEFCAKIFGWSREKLWGPSELRAEPDARYQRSCEACDGRGTIGQNMAFQCGACGGVGTFGLSPRHALQQLDTEFGRACWPDVWVVYALRRAAELDKILIYPARVVITDVRFVNEAAAIRAASGQVWRIRRPGTGPTGPAHGSEVEQFSLAMDALVSREIANDGGLPELHATVCENLDGVIPCAGVGRYHEEALRVGRVDCPDCRQKVALRDGAARLHTLHKEVA